MGQVNRRKSNTSLITCIYRRYTGKQYLAKMSEALILNDMFSKRQKRMLRVVVWNFQKEGREFSWTWKSKCFIEKHLLGNAETVGHREEF